MQIRDIVHSFLHCYRSESSQLDSSLFLDTLQRSCWYVALRMGNRHSAFLHWMLELLMAASLIDFIPTTSFQFLNDVPAIHL